MIKLQVHKFAKQKEKKEEKSIFICWSSIYIVNKWTNWNKKPCEIICLNHIENPNNKVRTISMFWGKFAFITQMKPNIVYETLHGKK